jgi:hypothetical protein
MQDADPSSAAAVANAAAQAVAPIPAAAPAANAQPAPANLGQGRGRGGGAQGPAIFYDSDFGRDIDTVLALAVLSNLGTKGRIHALAVSNSSLEAAALCDSVRRFYAGAPAGGRGGGRGGGGLVIGLSEKGAKLEAPLVSKPLVMQDADGEFLFPHSINELNDTAYPTVVLRNGLLTLRDGEGIFILAGPATNLMEMLALGRVPELLASKVKVLLVAAGTYPDGPADPRIQSDLAAATKLFATWPTPIVAVGTEVGAAVPYPAQSIEADFSWAPAHPVVEAYRANKAMPYDAPAPAVIAALYASNPSADYFHLSEPGIISVAGDGKTTFTPSPTGKHRYLLLDSAQKEQVTKDFTALASAKPAPRPQGRGRRGQ